MTRNAAPGSRARGSELAGRAPGWDLHGLSGLTALAVEAAPHSD